MGGKGGRGRQDEGQECICLFEVLGMEQALVMGDKRSTPSCTPALSSGLPEAPWRDRV